MKMAAVGLMVAALAAFSPSLVGDPASDERKGIIQEISEGLNGDVWTFTDGVETVTGPDHAVRGGTRSIRGVIGQGEDSYRAEYNARRVIPDNDYWYGWSVFFPEDMPVDEDHWGTIFTQFKFWPRTGIDGESLPSGGLGTHLYLASSRRGERVGHPGTPTLRMVHHWEDIDSDVAGERDIRYESFLIKAEPELGVWHDFVMHVRWSADESGFLKLWHQEDDSEYELVVDRSGPTMWKKQPEDQGPFFSAGPYAHGSVAARTIYSDEFRAGDATSSFDDVRPDRETASGDEDSGN